MSTGYEETRVPSRKSMQSESLSYGPNNPSFSELWACYSTQGFTVNDQKEDPNLSLQERLNYSHLF